MPDALMLFAAGFGTRMGALTRDRPKPLIEVAGRPLIDHALTLARGAGIGRIAVNMHYHADQLAAHLHGTDVAISPEPDAPLETGGGLRRALPLLGEGPVFTLNPDCLWRGPNPLSLLAQAWEPERMDALLMCIPGTAALGRTGSGDFRRDAAGRLTRGGDLVYGGAQILDPGGLADIGDRAFSLNLPWDRMLARGRLFGLSYPGQWCDVGTPEGIPLAEDMLRGAHV